MWRIARTTLWLGLGLASLTLVAAGARPLEGADPATPAKAAAHEILEATGLRGGLIVHLGCGDGQVTAALRAGDGFLVEGLDADAGQVQKARATIRALGLYGPVTAEHLAGDRLPYADNLVNLIVAEDLGKVPMAEVLRVLCPNGTAYLKKDGAWAKTVKPRPKEIDEWTHDIYDAGNNAVSHDLVVGPPKHLQWVGSPPWARHHDHMASMTSLVSAGGRLFYILDEGPTASIRLPAKWFLIARDAFSGVVLWKRPIQEWNTHLWPLKSGPSQMPRRLVAVGDRVYVTLGLSAPVSMLDAATGATLKTFEGTQGTEELLVTDGALLCSASDTPARRNAYEQKFTFVWANTTYGNQTYAWDESKSHVLAVRIDSGQTLWKKDYPVAPMTLAADRTHVYFHDGEKVVCLDRKTGGEAWTSAPVARRKVLPTGFAPTLLVTQDVVLFSGGDAAETALAADTGKKLWSAEHPASGHASPEDLLVAGGLVWAGAIAQTADSGVFKGRDLHTGEVKSEFPPDLNTYWFHHRCYRSKATDNFLLASRTGIEFIDFRAKHWTPNHWVRGGCLYGIMPANGLVYAPPHACACYIESKLNGFYALAPELPSDKAARPASDEERLERGPAYAQPIEAAANADEWPTFRHDAARSGATKTPVPTEVKPTWQVDIGGKLTAPVIAGEQVLVASVDTHTVYALAAASGKTLWTFTAGGRVDSPPTAWQGRVLFGSADGWVYCLRAADGALAWRFRAAPQERRLVASEQVESAWPVHGSVLVDGGVAACVAGRSMFLDGGLHLVRLDPRTGRKLSETVMDDRDPETGKNLQTDVKGLNMPVALPDVLSSDGKHMYMRSQQFDLDGKRQEMAPRELTQQQGEGAHLFSTVGFLDDTWFHRSLWLYGRTVTGGYGGWYRPGRVAPSGRMMVFDDSMIYSFSRKPEFLVNGSVLDYCLYAAAKEAPAEAEVRVLQAPAGKGKGKGAAAKDQPTAKKKDDASDWKVRQDEPMDQRWKIRPKWFSDQPALHAWAMVLAGRTLFLAGPPCVVNEQEAFAHPDDPQIRAKLAAQAAALEGAQGAILWAVSADDGHKLAELKLDALPVFDGLGAAGGRLYMTTKTGKVICLAGK